MSEPSELVRDDVEVEEVEPLALKGKSEPVQAYRLITVDEGEAIARHHDRPMVGREEELALLRSAFASASPGSGSPGHGGRRMPGWASPASPRSSCSRSRPMPGSCAAGACPTAEASRSGRCVEIIREAAAIEESDPPAVGLAKLTDIAGDPAVSERVASIASLGRAEFSVEEIRWGTRQAVRGPGSGATARGRLR